MQLSEDGRNHLCSVIYFWSIYISDIFFREAVPRALSLRLVVREELIGLGSFRVRFNSVA
eukprot:COSAG05_NODE_557_length_8701_cov_28.619972_3_plen_60_part_00